jgi:hypothetical protein
MAFESVPPLARVRYPVFHMKARTSKLWSLVFALLLLLVLRFFVGLVRTFRETPKFVKSWLRRTESRVVVLASSILWTSDLESSESSEPEHHGQGRGFRDDRFSEPLPSSSPVDVMMAPSQSLQLSSELAGKMLSDGDVQRISHRASRIEHKGRQSYTKAATTIPLRPRINRRALSLSLNLDGAPALLPPMPTYQTPKSHLSTSDSIYSSSPKLASSRRHGLSTSSSLISNLPAAAHIYTQLFPSQLLFSSESQISSRGCSNDLSDLTILSDDAEYDALGSSCSYPGNFPVRDKLDFSSLATVSQHVLRVNGSTRIRPRSEPTARG